MSFPKMGHLVRRVVGGIAVATALVACGGGSSTHDPFEPSRIVVLGDESSLLTGPDSPAPVGGSPLTQSGRRYGVNYLADGTFSCTGYPIWVQRLAAREGFVSARCNPDGVTDFKLVFGATVNARVGGDTNTIAAQVDALTLQDGDLVTVMAGAHDLFALAEDLVLSEEQKMREAARLGAALGQQVRRIARDGVRVVLVNVPDLGKSPRARAAGKSDLLSDLANAFNQGYGEGTEDNGLVAATAGIDFRRLVTVDAFTIVERLAEKEYGTDVSNVTQIGCTTALPDCTTATLVSGTDAYGGYLWADAEHLGPRAHYEIAEKAIDNLEDD